MSWSGEYFKCRNCGEVYPYRLSTCSCGGVCDKIADAPQGASSGLNSDDSVLADILEAAKQKEQEKRENELAQLYSAVKDVCSKNDYAAAISYLEKILEINPDSVNAKNLLGFCKNKVEDQRQDLSASGTNAGERKTVTVNGVEFVFRWCPAGTFMMGAPTSEDGRNGDEKQHQVTLTKGFWMMETQVTQKQWKAVMGSNPSNFKGDNLPVEMVSWNGCQEFCKKCTELGLPVQLPTESQWEYACRAGSSGACAGKLDEMAWYGANCGNKTCPVGTKKPNSWGLYDMHGNVWEWCQDWFGYYPSGSVTDPTGPANGSFRVFRGGCWYSSAQGCRSANRDRNSPEYRYINLGFRCVSGQ